MPDYKNLPAGIRDMLFGQISSKNVVRQTGSVKLIKKAEIFGAFCYRFYVENTLT